MSDSAAREPDWDIVPVWKQITPELHAQLQAFWGANRAIEDAAHAAMRARQAVCIGRDAQGHINAVATANVRVLPRLRQPMYYYRHYFDPGVRGQRQTIPFYLRAVRILQEYNASLRAPESLGVLVELENAMLASHYTRAYIPEARSTFIGYSPRGLQLRVTYFDDATLLPPARLPGR